MRIGLFIPCYIDARGIALETLLTPVSALARFESDRFYRVV